MFKPFSSIENASTKLVERWVSRSPEASASRYLVTEKLDGANFQILIDGGGPIRYFSRNKELEISEPFFDWQKTVMQDCRKELRALMLHSSFVGATIRVYGELFGSGVQRRIQYLPEGQKKFLPFEIHVDDVRLTQVEMDKLLNLLDMPEWRVPVLATCDTLEEAVTFDLDRETMIGRELGVEGNRKIEGVVITPLDRHLYIGQSHFIFKVKSKEFNDKMKVKTKVYKHFNGCVMYCWLVDVWQGYFNENRITDMYSKEGVIKEKTEIGKYIKLITEDVKSEFLEEYLEEFSALTDTEKSKLLKSHQSYLVEELKKEF